ncbi:FAD binding domain-containing protein [Candidatus Sumerlaeota bacterium]|nr:FAD binding domain-containing protein [Candidatus Sumerlaeota bacterium]
MKTNVAELQVCSPRSIDEALQQRRDIPGLTPIAGGTEVLVWLNDAKFAGKTYQSLHGLAKDWRYVRANKDGTLGIGALATYSDVRFHPVVKERYPLLVESARVTGALQIQNRGTPVGNIANGSPAADTVPSLLVYDAKLKLKSLRGERLVDLKDFFTGYRRNVMTSDELITEIVLPPPLFMPAQQHYRKVGTREAQAISKVVFAGARSAAGVRLAWGSLAPTTIRALKTEAALQNGADANAAWEILQREIAPIDDIRSTAEYRRKVARNILFEFLNKLANTL